MSKEMNRCPKCGKILNPSVHKTKAGGVPVVVVSCADCGVIVGMVNDIKGQEQSSSGAQVYSEQVFTPGETW